MLNQLSTKHPPRQSTKQWTFQDLSIYCQRLEKQISQHKQTIIDLQTQSAKDQLCILRLSDQIQRLKAPPSQPSTPPKPVQYPTSYEQATCFRYFPTNSNQPIPQLEGFLLYIQKKQKKQNNKPYLYWRASRKIQGHWHHIHICPAPNLSTLPNQLFEIAQQKIAGYIAKYKISPAPHTAST